MTTFVAASPVPLTTAAPVHGRFLWHDLMVPDVAAATRFYPPITGWTLMRAPRSGGRLSYAMWTNGASPAGGVIESAADEGVLQAPARWLPYIGTCDVDATYAEALALGARGLAPPRDIGLVSAAGAATVGRFAVLTDPQGVTFAIHRPADLDASTGGTNVVGDIVWHDLETTDHRAAFAFYAQLFGWAPMQTLDMGPHGAYQVFGRDGTEYGGMFDRSRDATPQGWLSYTWVADLGRALDAVRDGGGQVLSGPADVPGGGRVAQCADPQGARFALHESGRA